MAAMIAIASAGQPSVSPVPGSDRFSLPDMVFVCAEAAPFFVGMGGTETNNFVRLRTKSPSAPGWPEHDIVLKDALRLQIGKRDEHGASASFEISARTEDSDYEGTLTLTMPAENIWTASFHLTDSGKLHSFECDLVPLPKSNKQ